MDMYITLSRSSPKSSKPVITTGPYLERIFTFLWSHNGHNFPHIGTYVVDIWFIQNESFLNCNRISDKNTNACIFKTLLRLYCIIMFVLYLGYRYIYYNLHIDHNCVKRIAIIAIFIINLIKWVKYSYEILSNYIFITNNDFSMNKIDHNSTQIRIEFIKKVVITLIKHKFTLIILNNESNIANA